MSQINVDTIKNRLGTSGPTTPSLTVTNGATVGGALTVTSGAAVGSALTVTGNIKATGFVTATTYYGDGSQLTGIVDSVFNTGITSTVQLYPTSYETTVFTFPSTAGKEYIINSINASNVSTKNTEVNIIAALNFNTSATGKKVHLAYNIPIQPGGAVELLRQPQVANPSDSFTMWATDNTYAGVSSAVEVYMNYTTISDINYFSVGVSTSGIGTSLTGIFTSTTYPSVIESIHLANITDNGDYPVSVQITNGVSTSYLVKDLIIPRYAAVELCDMPKRIETNGIIKVSIATTNTIDVSISGKKITG